MLKNKTHLILDMNATFMFGHDRFAKDEDFYASYRQCNSEGKLSAHRVNQLIRAAYDYLDQCYVDPKYRECFPSVASAIQVSSASLSEEKLRQPEIDRLVEVFSMHELGEITPEYRSALINLRKKFHLALFIDIWSPKQKWQSYFEQLGLSSLFSAMSFSSDLAMVKPSPLPLDILITKLKVEKSQCLVIGDSAERDLGAATAAQLECILVGNQGHKQALAHYESLLSFVRDIK